MFLDDNKGCFSLAKKESRDSYISYLWFVHFLLITAAYLNQKSPSVIVSSTFFHDIQAIEDGDVYLTPTAGCVCLFTVIIHVGNSTFHRGDC